MSKKIGLRDLIAPTGVERPLNRAQRRAAVHVAVEVEQRRTPPAAATRPAVVKFQWPAILLILFLTFWAYSPVLHFQFASDDGMQIVHNFKLQSWSYLKDYFSQNLWSEAANYTSPYYRPLFLVWLRLNYVLFGLDPFYWHLTTLAAHMLTTLMVFALVRRLLPRDWIPAFLAALFFGLHPIVEPVAWISSVSEDLLASALVASLTCYAQSRGSKIAQRRWRLSGSLLCFACGLFLKETAATFPLMIFTFALLWSESAGTVKRTWFALVQTFPYLALTLIYLMTRRAVLHGIVATASPIGVKTFALTLPSVLLMYARLLVWPAGGPLFSTPLVNRLSSLSFVLPALVVIAAGLFFTWLCRKASKIADVAAGRLTILSCAWMAVPLLPALYLPALRLGVFVQTRYLYLPSIGFAVLFGLGLRRLASKGPKFLGIPSFQLVIALAIAAVMALGIRAQIQMWASNVTLFAREVESTPENRAARSILAAALVDEQRYGEAITQLQVLLSADDPTAIVDTNNLWKAYASLHDSVHAEQALARLCKLEPTASRLFQLGATRYNLGHYADAADAFRSAIAMDPGGVGVPGALGYQAGLGLALEGLGQTASAAEAFRQELAIHPSDMTAKRELASRRVLKLADLPSH